VKKGKGSHPHYLGGRQGHEQESRAKVKEGNIIFSLAQRRFKRELKIAKDRTKEQILTSSGGFGRGTDKNRETPGAFGDNLLTISGISNERKGKGKGGPNAWRLIRKKGMKIVHGTDQKDRDQTTSRFVKRGRKKRRKRWSKNQELQ